MFSSRSWLAPELEDNVGESHFSTPQSHVATHRDSGLSSTRKILLQRGGAVLCRVAVVATVVLAATSANPGWWMDHVDGTRTVTSQVMVTHTPSPYVGRPLNTLFVISVIHNLYLFLA